MGRGIQCRRHFFPVRMNFLCDEAMPFCVKADCRSQRSATARPQNVSRDRSRRAARCPLSPRAARCFARVTSTATRGPPLADSKLRHTCCPLVTSQRPSRPLCGARSVAADRQLRGVTSGAKGSTLSAPRRLTGRALCSSGAPAPHRARVVRPGRPCRFGFPSFVDEIRGALRRARRPVNPTGVKTCHTSMVS